MARRFVLAATGAIALAAAGLSVVTANAAPSTVSAKITTKRSCAKPGLGTPNGVSAF